jgi:hypothetical protein
MLVTLPVRSYGRFAYFGEPPRLLEAPRSRLLLSVNATKTGGMPDSRQALELIQFVSAVIERYALDARLRSGKQQLIWV